MKVTPKPLPILVLLQCIRCIRTAQVDKFFLIVTLYGVCNACYNRTTHVAGQRQADKRPDRRPPLAGRDLQTAAPESRARLPAPIRHPLFAQAPQPAVDTDPAAIRVFCMIT